MKNLKSTFKLFDQEESVIILQKYNVGKNWYKALVAGVWGGGGWRESIRISCLIFIRSVPFMHFTFIISYELHLPP